MGRREEQSSPRVQTSLAAVLVDSDGVELPDEIIDLSSGGFRRRTIEAVLVGEKVRLRVPRYGNLPATVRLVEGYQGVEGHQEVEGYQAGGRFLESITL